MLKNKIIVQYHYKPIFFFKKVYDVRSVKNSFIGAIKYYKSTLSIPIFPFLSSNKQYYIIEVIRKIFFNQKLSRN
jgi:dTDP-4-amino-4,6-dideoxygalactose transaminase